MTTEHPFAKAQWIGASADCVSPIIGRTFCPAALLSEPVKTAELYITGLGYFEAKINGEDVTEDRFVPVCSDYEKRVFTEIAYPCRDTFTHRIYYCKYDVTPLLRSGENCLEIQLGNGWYRQTERVSEGKMSFSDTLKTIYCLILRGEHTEAQICSDGSEVWYASEITYCNLFTGELHDATFRDAAAKPVQVLPPTESILSEQIGVPDRVIRVVIPKCVGEVNGKKIYDCGENISGVVRLHVTEAQEAGSRITLRFSEERFPDGSLNFESAGTARMVSGVYQIMTDTFICDGTARVFEPKFVWHAFRYFEAEGDFEMAEVLVIHSDVDVTATFTSSSEGLNYLYDAFLRTQLDNMHGSIPSDCPHRERLGYTGDGQATAPAVMMMFDSKEFYRKWIRDILDCQDLTRGHVQHTAPFMGGGGGPGGWGCAIALVPYAFDRQFDDVEMLRTCYEPIQRWIAYLDDHSENGLITSEEEGGWCLGDWAALEKMVLPEPFVNTYYHVRILRQMAEMAKRIGRDADAPAYLEKADRLCDAIRAAYRDPVTGHYCDGVQGADAYAAHIGLEPEVTARLAAEKYDALGHFDTGFLCTDILLEVLFEHGYADVAYKLLTSEDCGSFLYMKRMGATTIWEHWDGESSHNHPMFGGCTRQLFQSILGIRQAKDTHAYSTVEISPRVPKALERASGSILTPRGRISVSFEQTETDLSFHIEVPAAIKASFSLYGTFLPELTGVTDITVKK